MPPNTTTTTTTAHLKAELVQCISRLNASVVPAQQDLDTLFSLLAALSSVNPTQDPATSTLIDGRWVLLYTTSQRAGSSSSSSSGRASDQVFSPFQALSDVLYKAFYTYAPILAGSATGRKGSLAGPSGGIKSRGNFQTFDLAAGTVENEARFDAFGLEGRIRVVGTAEVVRTGPGVGKARLKAMFTSFSISLGGAQSITLPLAVPNLLRGGALQGPVGFVDTSYLDDELRISTGDKGSVFIAMRDKTTAHSTVAGLGAQHSQSRGSQASVK